MDIARDEVRVMTVHGAKGLEAPIVILADTTTVPKGPREPRMLSLPVANAAPGTPDRLVWAGRKADDPELVATARASRGARGRGRAPPPALRGDDACGGSAGDRGLARREPRPCGLLVRARQRRADDRRGRADGRRRHHVALAQGRAGDDRKRACIRRAGRASRRARMAPQDGAARKPPRAARSRPRARSGRRKPTPRRSRAGASCTGCCRRCPRCRRSGAPRRRSRTLARTKFEDRDAIVHEVLKLLDDPRLAALFAPGSRAEVPIVGTLPDGRRVSGQLDRLAVTANEVLIADYKSNRTVPGSIADIPPDYISQLALYRAVLLRLYPNHARARRAGLDRRTGAHGTARRRARRRNVKRSRRVKHRRVRAP